MAYAGLVSLAQTINQILNHDHSPTTPPHNQEIIRSIRDHAVDLQSILQDFPETVNSLDLEGQIGEVANAAEDVIEYLLFGNNPSEDCGSFGRRLKQVAEKFESTAGNVAKDVKISNDYLMAESSAVYLFPRRASTREDRVVAFEEDLHQILDRLTNSSSSGLQVLPIVGMGGIGKTTLAKLVYNDMFVKEHFDIQGWVTVSQDYDVASIALNLLASMKSKSKSESKINIPRKDEIQNYLKDKRYLIVMDDMWSKKAWDDVRKLFSDNDNGSRVIVTTRLQDVAQYVGHSHIMRLLCQESSWSLLKYIVFGDSHCPPHMAMEGQRIVARCRGLPLSIVVVAGLLSKIDMNLEVWMEIAESDGKLETIISLSYIHLPPHVKPCFLYMGGFPEDYEIRASELIKLWAAEGFSNRSNGSKSIENEAEDCLENLVERRLVLVNSRDVDGKIKSCSLHDIVRDFCIRQGRREKLLVPVVDYLPTPILRRHFLPLVLKNYKRISATWYDLDLKDSMHNPQTHSIICIPGKGYGRMGSVKNFSLLRVLHVLCINENWDWEPAQVFDLIYLTYLASNIPTSIIPPAISKLQNLQTLIIYRSEVRLPVEIWRLRQLRHLIAFSFHQLPHPEEEAIPLECLQTLSLAIDFICSERMVEMMPNIKKLGICYSGKKLSGEGYHLDNLMYLFRLEKLKLETLVPFRLSLNSVFPQWLKKLTLSGWGIPWSEMTIVASLPNLQVLKLRNYACDGELWETSEGEFDNLRLLLIDESNLQHWITDSDHFPMLECLMLHRCPYLSELPDDIGWIPTLQLIEIDDRYQSLLYSAKRIQEEQRELGNDDLQVRLKRF